MSHVIFLKLLLQMSQPKLFAIAAVFPAKQRRPLLKGSLEDFFQIRSL